MTHIYSSPNCPATTLTPAEHLRAWFTPERRKLISARSLDELAGRPPDMLSRFLAGTKHYTLSRGKGVTVYYPFLALLGYAPPAPPLSATSSPLCFSVPFSGPFLPTPVRLRLKQRSKS